MIETEEDQRFSEAGPSSKSLELENQLSRSYLYEKSKQQNGFGDQISRRKAWLYLLDLTDYEKKLRDNTENKEEVDIPQSQEVIPIDNEGWQIASHNLEEGSYDEDKVGNAVEGEEEDGWNVARSKRTRRRRRQSSVNDNEAEEEEESSRTRTNSTSRNGTMSTTTPESMSRDTSVSGFARIDYSMTTEQQNGDSSKRSETEKEFLKAQRKARKKSKIKQAKKAKTNVADGDEDFENQENIEPQQNDLGASIVHIQRSNSFNDEKNQSEDKPDVKKHKDEDQVALDIRRSFIASGDTPLRTIRRKELSVVINGVLRKHPSLNYYQGYHDVIGVLLSVMIPHKDEKGQEIEIANQARLDIMIEVACRLSLHFLRDAMTENMTPILGHLKVLRDIIRQSKLESIAKRVEQASPLPYFALPWILSIFSHDVEFSIACLIFDYVLTRGPKSVLFLSAALIEHFQEKIDSNDPAEMHHELSKLPNYINLTNLPLILNQADILAKFESNPLFNSNNSQIMGRKSVLFTWSSLPLQNAMNKEESQSSITNWQKADLEADETLQGDSKEIVLNALPTPPISENGEEEGDYGMHGADTHIKKDQSLVLQKWWKSDQKHKQQLFKNASTFYTFGTLGALGAIVAFSLYGGKVGLQLPIESTSIGLRSAFPAGLRFAEPFRVILRNVLQR